MPLAGLGWRFPLAVVLGYPRRDPGGVGAWERQQIRKKKNPGAVNAPGLAGYLEIFNSSNKTATGKIKIQNSVIYSTSSDDISEIGIFHAVSEEKSLELLDDLTDYLSDLKEEKGAFVRNYLPDEQKKLDGAKVRRFGNYVVFTVLPEAQSNAVFEKIDKILK